MIFSFQPSYGTPVTEGIAQLRVYNGFNCKFTLSTSNLNAIDSNSSTNVQIGSLSAYEKLDIVAKPVVESPYFLQGESNTQCADVAYSGYFNLKENTANSFFISKKGMTNFTDNNEKAIGGVHIR